MQVGSWFGALAGAPEVQGLVGIEVPITAAWGAAARVGAQWHGDLDPLDGVIAATWVPVREDTFVVRLQPGLNVPLGGIGTGLYFTPESTASVDPVLGADVVYGGTWLVGGSAFGRLPLYDGWDRRRQGPYLRLDLRGSRRIGVVVGWLGPSFVRQAPSSPVGAAPDFTELSATGGAVINVAPRWSLSASARAPIWVSDGAVRQLSGGLSVRWVVGGRDDDDDHHDDDDDDDDHGHDDGHDHGG